MSEAQETETPLLGARPRPSITRVLLLSTLYLFLLGLSAGAAYLVWQSNQVTRYEKLLFEISALKQDQALNALEIKHLHNQVADFNQPAEMARLQQDLKTLNQQYEHLNADGVKLAIVLDAAFSARTAERIVQQTGDLKSALVLLEQADSALSALNDPQIVPARAALATDQARLKAQDVPDIDQIWQRLTRLAPSFLELTPRALPSLDIKELIPTEEQTRYLDWRERFSLAWQELKGLVRIQHHEQALKSLVDPMEQALVRERLQLLCETARLSVLQKSDLRFHESLHEMLRLIELNFDSHADSTQKAQIELKSLDKLYLTVDLPNLGQSVDHLNQLISNLRH